MKKVIFGVISGFIIGVVGTMFLGVVSNDPIELTDSEGIVSDAQTPLAIEQLVERHAEAWETGDIHTFTATIHDDIVFAYPGRRLQYMELLEDFTAFHDAFTDTKVYIQNILVDGDMVSVEWQFATTEVETGKRTVVSDAIIGKVVDGKIISWKEYLDGRVSRMQQVDALPLEEGEEAFPSPVGSLRNFCEVITQ